MYNDKYFIKFCEDRNIKESTIQGYVSSLEKYSTFHNLSLKELLDEANADEKNKIPLKERRLKERLLSYRKFLMNSNLSSNSVKTYFSKLKTFYMHYEIELPYLPNIKYDKQYETNYLDLPTKENIKDAIEISSLPIKAIILFMSSSGTAKAETLSLTVGDFINATKKYHSNTTITSILDELSKKEDIVPTLYLKRIKTDKYYYTFCSPEASKYILKYLKNRKNLKLNDKLFPFSSSLLMTRFQEINDQMGWGFKGNYRFFRSHTLRKYHASNIQLPQEYVDALQGRSKDSVHETYIKTNPDKLKEIYVKNMKNVMIFNKQLNSEVKEEINITINIFLSDKQINLY